MNLEYFDDERRHGLDQHAQRDGIGAAENRRVAQRLVQRGELQLHLRAQLVERARTEQRFLLVEVGG